jgi:C-terminal processing protease CtpA/Prc
MFTRRATATMAATIPIVVLVNRNSASAAEIVSGALQDHDRAWILGDNTFGKGLVQTVYPLIENTGLTLTTAKVLHAQRPPHSARLQQRFVLRLLLPEQHGGAQITT